MNIKRMAYLFISVFFITNAHRLPVMVDLSILTNSVRVHPGVKKNLHERNQLRKNKPDVDHLDIGSGWKARGHADEEGG